MLCNISVAAPSIQTLIFFSNETCETELQKSLSLVLSLFEFLPNFHTVLWIFRALEILELWIRNCGPEQLFCSYFLLLLLPAVAQSLFKKLGCLWGTQNGY